MENSDKQQNKYTLPYLYTPFNKAVQSAFCMTGWVGMFISVFGFFIADQKGTWPGRISFSIAVVLFITLGVVSLRKLRSSAECTLGDTLFSVRIPMCRHLLGHEPRKLGPSGVIRAYTDIEDIRVCELENRIELAVRLKSTDESGDSKEIYLEISPEASEEVGRFIQRLEDGSGVRAKYCYLK